MSVIPLLKPKEVPLIGQPPQGEVVNFVAHLVYRCGCQESSVMLLTVGLPSPPCPACGTRYIVSGVQLTPDGHFTASIGPIQREGSRATTPDGVA